jgi:hypothetical protein
MLTLMLSFTLVLGLISSRNLLLLVDKYNVTVATSASKKILAPLSVSMRMRYKPIERLPDVGSR